MKPIPMNPIVRQLAPLLLAPLLLIAAVLVWRLSGVELDRESFVETIRRLAPGTIGVLCLLHVAQQLGRTARLAVLLPRRVALPRLGAVVLLHQFLCNMLPLKTGSWSLPELLKREGVERSQTLATMFTGVGLDLLVTTILMGVAGFVLQGSLGEVRSLQQPLLAVSACLLAAVVVTLGATRRLQEWLEQDHAWLRDGWRAVVAGRLRAFLRTLSSLSPPRLAAGIALTLVNALVSIAFSFLISYELAPQLSWQAILLVVLIMRLVGQFSIQGLAGLGTSEAMLVLLFCCFGLAPSEALALTVLGRAIYLALVVTGGGCGALLLLADRPRPDSVFES
jgi:uncharacterized protein (TIRG00374 family)